MSFRSPPPPPGLNRSLLNHRSILNLNAAVGNYNCTCVQVGKIRRTTWEDVKRAPPIKDGHFLQASRGGTKHFLI